MTAIRIFDTTLRDGEQAPGFSMSEEGKLRMARALAALKVDVIEAGFAAASPGDARAIERVAGEVEGPVLASLARATPGDIMAAAKALKGAKSKRLHIFLGTSPLHREFKLKLSEAEVLRTIHDMVSMGREHFDDVEFSAEDAIRTEAGFLVEALSTAAAAGASTLNVPDTVGYATPREIEALFRMLTKKVSRGDGVVFSAHCHDDLGMAVANSLAAARGGARQIEVAMNGIGERAGNCALEDVVMAIRTRRDALGFTTNVDTTKIMAASRMLSKVTNTHPPRNKAIVGANAFAHEAGIHQHGVLANPETYEIMKPEHVGLAKSALVLGKHSGKHALKARAAELGFELSDNELAAAFAVFKDVADEVGIVEDARLAAILSGVEAGETANLWTLARIEIRAPMTSTAQPVARVELNHSTRGRVTDIATAPGSLDAAFQAVSHIMETPAKVESLDMQYIAADPDEPADDGQGADVLVEMTIGVDGGSYPGRARARDIVPACVTAYIDALNNAIAARRRGQTSGGSAMARGASAA
ncbi:2-isopropylmalate synthase [Glycocaulis profundi]|nr:2-isopropylmalate synthase [Glycocaulis profundi]